VFAGMAGDYLVSIKNMMRVIDGLVPASVGSIENIDAPSNNYPIRPAIISTDPPYYDNIGYASFRLFLRLDSPHTSGDLA
jgi:putative DNA methylase